MASTENVEKNAEVETEKVGEKSDEVETEKVEVVAETGETSESSTK